ncbi:MAG: alpha/beta hydrolase [Chitinophagales bacterium]|nr:alpha/beta hydrolase [Chitinophagales bacterium]
MKVYFIPGLGADRRVFKNITLPAGYEPVYVDWLKPLEGESLAAYAERVHKGLNPQIPYILVGLSMGGMIASEIAQKHPPALLVLISSIPCSSHLPGYYRKAAALKLQKLIPISLFKSMAVMKRFFTTETPEDKKMLKAMIRDVDPKFIYWSLEAILGWKMEEPFPDRVHIHGTRDELLPVKYTQPTHRIEKGGHLLVMNRGEEVSKILEEVLNRMGEEIRNKK